MSDLKKVETAICAAVYNSYEIGALSDLEASRNESSTLREKIAKLHSERMFAEAERDTALVRVAELKAEFADKISQIKAVSKEREATLEMQIRTLSASLARAEAEGLDIGKGRPQASSDSTWAQRELDDRRIETQALVSQRVSQPANRFAAARESPATAARKSKSVALHARHVDSSSTFTSALRRCATKVTPPRF